MTSGSVSTLVILGGNPDYDAPSDLGFAAAAKKVATTIALATHVHETAKVVSWSIPSAHFLESWDDARAMDGTLSVVQPLILPLFGGKGASELLGLLAAGKDQAGHDLVRETWKPILGETDFEKRWNRVLHDGVLAGSATPTVIPGGFILSSVPSPADAAGAIEVHFRPSPYLHDGRYPNDG